MIAEEMVREMIIVTVEDHLIAYYCHVVESITGRYSFTI